MPTINYSELKENLPKLIEKFNDDHEPLCLEFPNSRKAILLSEQDYSSLIETLYLLSNNVNGEKLLKAANRNQNDAVSWTEIKEQS